MGEKVNPDAVLKHKQCRDMTTSEPGTLNLKPLSIGTPIVKLLKHVFAQTTTFRIAEAGYVVKVNIFAPGSNDRHPSGNLSREDIEGGSSALGDEDSSEP